MSAFKMKTGGALHFATTQIIQSLKADDLNAASLWKNVGTRISRLEMIAHSRTDKEMANVA
jgi:hypothetical protein